MQQHPYQLLQDNANTAAATSLIPTSSNHPPVAYPVSRISHPKDGVIAPPQMPHRQHSGQNFQPQKIQQTNHQRGGIYLANTHALHKQQQQQQQQHTHTGPLQAHAQIRPGMMSVPNPLAGTGFQANSLTDIRPIATSMNRLNLRRELITSFLLCINKLPPAYKFVIEKTCVFKFGLRPAGPAEFGRAFSPVALFFLEKLKKGHTGGLPNHDYLLGMRCNCCFRHPVYIKGCTNFLDVRDDEKAVIQLRFAMRGRLRHLISCPHVPGNDKGILFGYKEDDQSINAITSFLRLWLQIVKGQHFGTWPTLPTQGPIQSVSRGHQTTAGRQNALPSTGSEFAIDMYDRLSDAVDLASSVVQSSEIILDNLTGEIVTSDGKESPVMETVLDNYQIRLTRDSRSKWQANIICCNCKAVYSDLSLLQDSISQTDASLLRKFWIEHSSICSCTHSSVKGIFRKRGSKLLLDEVNQFCQRWKKHLVKSFRNMNLNVTQEPIRYDCMRPVSLAENLTFGGALPNYRQPNPPALPIPSISVLKKDIIIGNELYRDSEGNKAFRNVISTHRCLFHKVSQGQKDFIVDQVIQFMEKDGFIFKTVGPGGVCTQSTDQKRRTEVRQAFEKGFPEMLRRPVDSRAPSKVMDVEYSPMVGIIHGRVCWKMNNKLLSPMLDAKDIKASRHHWERKPNPTPQDIVDAIKHLNPQTSPTSNPSHQSGHEGTENSDKATERATGFPANPKSSQKIGHVHLEKRKTMSQMEDSAGQIGKTTKPPLANLHQQLAQTLIEEAQDRLPSVVAPSMVSTISTEGAVNQEECAKANGSTHQPENARQAQRSTKDHSMALTGMLIDGPHKELPIENVEEEITIGGNQQLACLSNNNSSTGSEVRISQNKKQAPSSLSMHIPSKTPSSLATGAKVLKETAKILNLKTVANDKQSTKVATEESGKRKVCEHQSDSSKRIRLDAAESQIVS